eukprot:3876507-Prymnesium_polylepis.1
MKKTRLTPHNSVRIHSALTASPGGRASRWRTPARQAIKNHRVNCGMSRDYRRMCLVSAFIPQRIKITAPDPQRPSPPEPAHHPRVAAD